MRSTAAINRHPIHPSLIPDPHRAPLLGVAEHRRLCLERQRALVRHGVLGGGRRRRHCAFRRTARVRGVVRHRTPQRRRRDRDGPHAAQSRRRRPVCHQHSASGRRQRTEWRLARRGIEAQRAEEERSPSAPNNLHAPIDGDHHERGDFPERRFSVYTWMRRHPRATAGRAETVGAIGVAASRSDPRRASQGRQRIILGGQHGIR